MEFQQAANKTSDSVLAKAASHAGSSTLRWSIPAFGCCVVQRVFRCQQVSLRVVRVCGYSTHLVRAGQYLVTDALSQITSNGYDAMSNQTSITDALSRVTNYEYDDFNRLKKVIYPPATTGATRLQELIEYDAAGNVKKKTDTAGRETTYTYDNVNRMIGTTDPGNKTTSFQYDALSRTTAVVDALNQQYGFSYDALAANAIDSRLSLDELCL